jgi:hypothetical protein
MAQASYRAEQVALPASSCLAQLTASASLEVSRRLVWLIYQLIPSVFSYIRFILESDFRKVGEKMMTVARENTKYGRQY